MSIKYHPKRGTIVTVNFDQGFREPEMVKRRLCVIVSPPIEARPGLCTVVPLSTTQPQIVQRYHYEIDIPFKLPNPWGNRTRWVKADMICAVGWHRIDLLRIGKDENGKRIYVLNTLSTVHMARIGDCILHGLGLR